MGQTTDEIGNNNDVYNNLTESNHKSSSNQGKLTAYLLLCCLSACMGSFCFGYNIGSTNLPTPLIKDFFIQRYYPDYNTNLEIYKSKSAALTADKSVANGTEEAPLVSETESIKTAKSRVDEVDANITLLWTVTTALFVVGGMFGAFGSKYVLDFMGRKKGILFHYLFTLVGSILVFIAPYVCSPECVIISRFLFGVQGGLMCGLIPTYLNEISPKQLRGATGVLSQLFITVGILIAQTLGFRQILGTANLWHYLLALPILPSLIGGLSLLIFFPESPKALLLVNKDKIAATKALKSLRNSNDVSDEIEEINLEARDSNTDEGVSLKELFTLKELRWPLLTGLILNLTQQLCGINAIFFYSGGIFERASIRPEHIQYAVFSTGLINVICTIAVVPLIDRLGRKPLLVVPMFVMIVDFILLTVCLVLKENSPYYSYMSIVCIVVFIMCFAVGLGPIPFIYVAECFRQDARGAALAICMFANWVANLLLTLTFEYLAKVLNDYVFIVFTVIVGIAVVLIIIKVPETKGRSAEEIMDHFTGEKRSQHEESANKLMPNTKV